MEPKEIAQRILKTLENGWNNASGTEFAQHFADRSEYVDIRGTLHQNSTPKLIGDEHDKLFVSLYTGSKVTFQLLQAMFIDQNTILVNAGAELDAPSGPLAGKNNSTITLVLIKSGNDWKIRAFQNTVVKR